MESQLLAEHMHPLATGAILQFWCLLTPQAWHSLWEGACPSLHQSPAALSAEQTLILLCIPSVHIFLMETVFIQEKETQILKSTKAIRICISHIKQEPQNFSSSGITSSYISAPSPFFARSAHRLISYLCAYLQHTEKKMWDFKQLVSKQHQQMNSELALKRWLICRVKARSDHWPAKKKKSPIFHSFSWPFPGFLETGLEYEE